jgi:hypothetical protein
MPGKASKPVPPAADAGRLLQLTQSAGRGELVAVIGTGVSVALTGNKNPAMTWKGLVRHGFAYGRSKGKIDDAQASRWEPLLESTDLDDLLSAAELVGRRLEAPAGTLYARWLENVFKPVQPAGEMMKGIEAVRAAGIPICTLNYDPLLERVTGLPAITVSEKARVAQWMSRELPGILHLHGSWDAPATCILGIRDYETTLHNDVRDLIQRSLGAFRRLLFIGCGDTFADPNFSALIAWLRQHMGAATPAHYALVLDSEVAERDADSSWHGFVEPVGYGKKHEDLPRFLETFAPLAKTAKKLKSPSKKTFAAASRDATLLSDYRTFLLKDSGQMTIEGVRADMDVAQRRFELERLFVPISVLPAPPDIPPADPEREKKLLEWQEKNSDPRPFGEVFAANRALALLALPGGGKTLLLKRLAVAYANPLRRQASVDGLPDLDVTPVLIRCREWREHLHRPILTLLNSIPDITGQASLAGLKDALLPLLKEGRILLLVDGLDEIHDDALRTTFAEHLESFMDDYPRTRLVVTSREAGFGLVAPTVARFCERWRLAPLDPEAITALCAHWHRLMLGESPAAEEEAKTVAETLLSNASLRRLAENPLLLTMLLVVKHGAGGLPPDRASLYDRAVEVLLDTWNIQGHERLNPKEAVPQLAFVAFRLMRDGRQTATGTELLALIEEARENVPQIRRQAQGSAEEFLQRVELRSSLLVEAGRQKEGAGTVPFYQFRHLTFQEYLAAVAAVEGHYREYDKTHTVLTPLQDHLLAEEWKEVVPMAAVLAKKRAEPLISALVQEATSLPESRTYEFSVPAPISRLAQCLTEEAEATQETLTAALRLIARFANIDYFPGDWQALCRGPYGEELFHQAWVLYRSRKRQPEGRIRVIGALFARFRRSDRYWAGVAGQGELRRMLESGNEEDVGRGLLTCCGLLWLPSEYNLSFDLQLVEQKLFREERHLHEPATQAWALLYARSGLPPPPTPSVFDRLLLLWLTDLKEDGSSGVAGFALRQLMGLPRDAWRPALSDAQRRLLRRDLEDYHLGAACGIAFHDRNVWPEEELAKKLLAFAASHLADDDVVAGMLRQLEIDQTILADFEREMRARAARVGVR